MRILSLILLGAVSAFAQSAVVRTGASNTFSGVNLCGSGCTFAASGGGAITATTITGAITLANTQLTTVGDVLTVTSGPVLARLAKGTQYQTLQGGATNLTWDAVHLDEATAVSGILQAQNGGTENGFFKISGPASTEKTWAIPNASIDWTAITGVIKYTSGVPSVIAGSASDCILVDGTSGPCGSGGGGVPPFDTAQCAVSVATPVITVPASCKVALGTVPTTIGGSATVTTSSGTALVYIYLTSAAVFTAGHNLGGGAACNANITCVSGITAFPADSYAIATIQVTSGVAGALVDYRAALRRDVVTAGTGITASDSGGVRTLNSNQDAVSLQGVAVKTGLSCASDGFVLKWVLANSRFECLTSGASSNVLQTATVTLTTTNVNNLVGTPFTLVAAPGAGTFIKIISVTMSYTKSTAFTDPGSSDVVIKVGSISYLFPGSAFQTTLTGSVNQVLSVSPGVSSGTLASSALDNGAVTLTNYGGNNYGAGAGSTLKITTEYIVETL